jgi:hypothetical protein
MKSTLRWWFSANLISLCLAFRVAAFDFDPGDFDPGDFDPGDIPGGIPAMVLMSQPANGQNNVAVDAPVKFTFLTAMSPAQSITWTGSGIVSANFTYSWSADAKTLTCTYKGNFPASTVISWTLDPAVFKDKAGGALMPVNNSGIFTTGSGSGSTNGPCDDDPSNDGLGVVSVAKMVQYLQTSASPPVIDPDSGAVFSASVTSPATNAVTQATLQLPNGTSKPLTSLFGHIFLMEQFDTIEDLDKAFPSGVYKLTVQRASGSAVFNLNIGTTGAPPTPQITNYPQTQAYNANADFTLQWLPFSNVTANDSLMVSVSDNSNNEFHAPDPCIPRVLPNTATSVVIPKGILSPASIDFDATLTFGKVGTMDTNSVRDIYAFSSYTKQTSFKMRPSGQVVGTKPELQKFVRDANGTVHFQVKAAPNAVVMVEGSTDLVTWTTVSAGPTPASGLLEVTDAQAAGMKRRFYRASL